MQHPNFWCRWCQPSRHFHCPSTEAVRWHLGRSQWKVSDVIGFPHMFLTAFHSVARSLAAPVSAACPQAYSLSQWPRIPTTGHPSIPQHINTPPRPLPASTAIYSVTARHITLTTGECMSTLEKFQVLTYIIADVPPNIFSVPETHADHDPGPNPYCRNSGAHVHGDYRGTEQ